MNTGVKLIAGELAKSLCLFQLEVTLSTSILSKETKYQDPNYGSFLQLLYLLL